MMQYAVGIRANAVFMEVGKSNAPEDSSRTIIKLNELMDKEQKTDYKTLSESWRAIL